MICRSTRFLILLAAAVAATVAEPARAADLELALEGGYNDMTNASRSAQAIFDGTSGGPTGGLSARYALGRSFFVSLAGRYFTRKGERVFVAAPGSPAFRLGHPLTVKIIPVYASLGYRFSQKARLVPYVTAGGGVTAYRERSTVAGEVLTYEATKPSAHLALGADFGRGRVRFGAEAGYSFVPKTIGDGINGVSKVYGEDDVGGLSLLGRVAFAF
jgi:hypothetical protein